VPAVHHPAVEFLSTVAIGPVVGRLVEAGGGIWRRRRGLREAGTARMAGAAA